MGVIWSVWYMAQYIRRKWHWNKTLFFSLILLWIGISDIIHFTEHFIRAICFSVRLDTPRATWCPHTGRRQGLKMMPLYPGADDEWRVQSRWLQPITHTCTRWPRNVTARPNSGKWLLFKNSILHWNIQFCSLSYARSSIICSCKQSSAAKKYSGYQTCSFRGSGLSFRKRRNFKGLAFSVVQPGCQVGRDSTRLSWLTLWSVKQTIGLVSELFLCVQLGLVLLVN